MVQYNTDNVSFWAREQVCLKTITKDSGSSSLQFLFCNPTQAGVIWPWLCCSVGTRLGELVPKNDDTLVITTAEGNKPPFVPNTGVLCLLSASMK